MVEKSTGESQQDISSSSSIHTEDLDDDFVEVILTTSDVSPARHKEQSPSITAPLYGVKGTIQAVNARTGRLTTVSYVLRKGCRMCEEYPDSRIHCCTHAFVEPRQPPVYLELERARSKGSLSGGK
jgi:hypothetical protein